MKENEMRISKTVLASFNAIEVSIEVYQDRNAPPSYDEFFVVLRAMRDQDLFNFDELPADTLEEANAIVATVMTRLTADDLYDFSNGAARDWLF
jgi:hypothetical protein